MRAKNSIWVFLLLLVGCGPSELEPELIESRDSPAAAYVDELWDLAPDGYWVTYEDPADGELLAPDGSTGLILEEGDIYFEHEDQSIFLFGYCTNSYEIDPMPILAGWSKDSQAVLIMAGPSLDHTLDSMFRCFRSPARLIYLPSLRRAWRVQDFSGIRAQALAEAVSPDSFIALPALEFLAIPRLKAFEAEALHDAWVSAGPHRRRHLERVIFGSLRCERMGSIAERLLMLEDLDPQFQRALLLEIVEERSGRTRFCLDLPAVLQALGELAASDDSVAQVLQSLE